MPHELSLFSCLSLTHRFKTSGLLISNISELNSVHRNNTSVRQESFNHLAFNKYYFTSEISMSGSFQLCFYLIIEQTFCPQKKILKIPKLLKLDLTSNSKPDIRSVHLVSLEEGQRKTGQKSKVTPQDAAFELTLKTCLCTAQSGIVCHIATFKCACRGEIKVLPFLIVFLCSGVTAPGVDNNRVILLSVAASLTLTDHFSSALVYHAILSWHSAECFPI